MYKFSERGQTSYRMKPRDLGLALKTLNLSHKVHLWNNI